MSFHDEDALFAPWAMKHLSRRVLYHCLEAEFQDQCPTDIHEKQREKVH